MLLFSAYCCPIANAEDITFARPELNYSISATADEAFRWREGKFEVLHLRGNAQIRQAEQQMSADEAILWVEIPDENLEPSNQAAASQHKVIVYLEGNALIDLPRNGPAHANTGQSLDRIIDTTWLGRLFTTATVDLSIPATPLGVGDRPEIFERAYRALVEGTQNSIRLANFQSSVIDPQTGNVTQVTPSIPDLGETQIPLLTTPTPIFSEPIPGRSPANAGQGGNLNTGGKVNFSARDSTVSLNSRSRTNELGEREITLPGGVRVTIKSRELNQMEQFRGDKQKEIVILADNVVGWESTRPDGSSNWEIYLEGNVIFAKDSRVIYADRMYYDAGSEQGTILNAEVLAPAGEYQGLARIKADVIQQVSANNLQAYGAAVTTSRLGVPRYWMQSSNLGLTSREVPVIDEQTGNIRFNPQTGIPESKSEYFIESNQNRVYAGGIPVFAWPRFRSKLDDPTFYIEQFKINNDRIFGTQVLTKWNMYQILGVDSPPAGTKWNGIVDYLSERGLGAGSEFFYRRNGLFGIPGRVKGEYRAWFINDKGLDQLGRGRFNLQPEEEYRGRVVAKHLHQFYPGYQLKAEFGYITDRNFLEQFYEREWDTYKDATTGLWLERNVGTQSFNLTANLQVNDFFTQTSWLPKLDHFVLGQPLGRDRFVWHSHSHFGYGRLRAADAPLVASEAAIFDPLAWEADVDGIRAGTRHEIDMPVQVGPVKLVPYVLGDATFWQEDINGDDLFRVYGQAGVKASLPFWRVDPTIQSTLWNVNGLAHKVTFDVDAYLAESSQDLERLPLYDQLDDDSQEDFRRRFAFGTFGILPGGDTPLQYDERFYALRSGLQSYVTSPSAEIADDLAVVKFGARQRWQTKRGLPGQERIIDWITLDAETVLFPNADRDNFGASWGMFNYDFRWHIGNRFSLVSDGYLDFFGQGLRTVSFGANVSKPEMGNIYLGYRMIEGPISSNIITASAIYRMSEKWGIRGSSQVDFGEVGTIGHNLAVVYIGESFLWSFGINADVTRDNVGFKFGFEPRFMNRGRLFRPAGQSIPPAGSRWLE